MNKFGLIGCGIAHSLSPMLFKEAYNGDFEYDLIDVDNFEQGLKCFFEGEYKAVNITAPFKEEAFRVADECSCRAETIGAANVLLKRADGTLYADNFDYDGVVNALGAAGARYTSHGVDTGKAVVIGYGGAGRAAFFAAKDLFAQVVVCNRTQKEEWILPLDALESELKDASCVIYTLPCGISQIKYLYSLSGDVLVLEAGYAHRFIDVAYLKARYIPGENWLFWQAVAAYRSMTGCEPNVGQMKEFLKQ